MTHDEHEEKDHGDPHHHDYSYMLDLSADHPMHVCVYSCGRHRLKDLRPHLPSSPWMSIYYSNYCYPWEKARELTAEAHRRQEYKDAVKKGEEKPRAPLKDYSGGVPLGTVYRKKMGFFGDPMDTAREEGTRDCKTMCSAIRSRSVMGAGFQRRQKCKNETIATRKRIEKAEGLA